MYNAYGMYYLGHVPFRALFFKIALLFVIACVNLLAIMLRAILIIFFFFSNFMSTWRCIMFLVVYYCYSIVILVLYIINIVVCVIAILLDI